MNLFVREKVDERRLDEDTLRVGGIPQETGTGEESSLGEEKEEGGEYIAGPSRPWLGDSPGEKGIGKVDEGSIGPTVSPGEDMNSKSKDEESEKNIVVKPNLILEIKENELISNREAVISVNVLLEHMDNLKAALEMALPGYEPSDVEKIRHKTSEIIKNIWLIMGW